MTSYFKILQFLILFAFIACSSESNKLVPRKDPDKVEQKENSFTFISKVDLLFVVDTSTSMDKHQQRLANNLNDFAARFMNVGFIDYHIGTISSNRRDRGELQGDPQFITKRTPNREQAVVENVLLGTGGLYSDSEYFFDPIYMALSDPLLSGEHKDYYRSDALLVVIMLTDTEDNGSNISGQGLYDYLLDLKKGDQSLILTYGAIIDEDNLSNCRRDNAYKGYLTNFFQISKGTYFDLCSPKFGEEIALLTDELLRRVSLIRLNSIPVVETIEVWYGNTLIPQDALSGWSYDPKLVAIRLGPELELPDLDEGLNITYNTAEVIPDK